MPDGADAGGTADCGASSSSTSVARDTALTAWTIVSQPIGTRPGLPITYTPSDGTTEWQPVNAACAGPDPNNECSAPVASGDVTGRTDVLCSNGADDIIGDAGGTGGVSETDWPDMSGSRWPLPALLRTSASAANGGSGAPTGGPNAYVLGASPWPTIGPNAFAFGAIDTAMLTRLYLSGTAPFPLPSSVRLQVASATSSYASQAGLGVSAVLRGGSPDRPPDDGFICFDSPDDSVMSASLRTPDADRVIPRWTIITSAVDLRFSYWGDMTQVLLDWACITVGAGEPDADGDCDPDATDSNDAVKDIDGDLVPDGIERALGSNPTVADTDGDGSDDFHEITLFTDPTVADSDGDGQGDRRDDFPTNGYGSDTADAANAFDDNCPAVANGSADGDPIRPGIQASQLNTDSLRQYHGMGIGTGDSTNPTEDLEGDACDTDDDNDGLPDATERVFTIVPWSGGTDPGGADLPDTSICAGPGLGAPPIDQQLASGGPSGKTWSMDGPYMGDMDLDMVLDGRECEFRSRPDLALRAIATCNNVVVDPDGCAQPNNGLGGGAAADPDGDGLFLAFSPAAHTAVEATYRTMGINIGAGVVENDIDGDGLVGTADRNADHYDPAGYDTWQSIGGGLEALSYGSAPGILDTDRDRCVDDLEIIDTSGNGKADAGDQLQFVIKKNAGPNYGKLDPDYDGDIDYYDLVNWDFNRNKTLDAGDQLLMANAVAKGYQLDSCGNGGYPQPVIGALAKNLP